MKNPFKFENFILFLVFALPLYLVRFRFGFIPTNLWEILAVALIIGWLIAKRQEISIADLFEKYRYFIVCSAFIFLGFLASSSAMLFSSGIYVNDYVIDYLHGLAVIKSWFLVPMAFVAMAGNIFGLGNIKKIYAAYFFSAAVVAAISLIFLLFGKLTFDGRLEAFFNSPNYLAMYLAPGLIFGTSLAQGQKLNIKSHYLFLVIIAASLYFTYSYAAWLAVIVSLAVVFILTRRTKRRGWLMSAIVLFGLAVFFQADSNKFAGLMNSNGSSSLDSRIVIWRAAGKIIQDNWFWGIGPDNFQAVYLDYQKYFPPYLEWAVPHPHNVFLAFWLSGGALGLAGFLGLLYFYFQKITRRLKEAGQDSIKRMIAAASCGVMIYILFHGLFDATYFKNDLAVVFWLSFLALL